MKFKAKVVDYISKKIWLEETAPAGYYTENDLNIRGEKFIQMTLKIKEGMDFDPLKPIIVEIKNE